MALRKASSYSHRIARPYTRNSRSKQKAYIKVIPFSKIVKFSMGDQASFRNGKHKFIVSMISQERVQVRDTALESGRMHLHKIMEDNSPGFYFIAVKVTPHHFLRENKSAGGMAGADRISTGMTQSFGQVIGRSAIVSPGSPIFIVSCADEKTARIARDALNTIRPKIPAKTRIVFERRE
ncbi:50S ribosomal protein L16 [Candidatus Pacearchaeota archaeon]|nr:50S ribosomal protein L16 [Candidatus Pacearchaeota archaeon]